MPHTKSDCIKGARSLTTGIVAEMLQINPNTVRAMCERGEFHGAIRIGDWWRIPADAVKPYLPGAEAKP